MADTPLVSVVIPSFNCVRYIAQSVESALKQSYRPLEVIVIDDGSTDETASILSAFRAEIRYVYQSNQGLSAARNRGIAEARGSLLAFLDSDDLWKPEKVERQVECLRAESEAGLVHTDVIHFDEATSARASRKYPGHLFHGHCYHRFFWSSLGPPSAVMVRRECLEKVGLFDEAIRRPSTQDWDLWMRIARHYAISYIDEPLTLYRQHANNASKDRNMMADDELYILLKAMRNDPSLRHEIGRAAVNRRLWQLYFDLGYGCLQRSERKEAIRTILHGFRYGPCQPLGWKLCVSACFPRSVRNRLQKARAYCDVGKPRSSMTAPPCS